MKINPEEGIKSLHCRQGNTFAYIELFTQGSAVRDENKRDEFGKPARLFLDITDNFHMAHDLARGFDMAEKNGGGRF